MFGMQEIQGMRVASSSRVIPPASAPLQKIRPMQVCSPLESLFDPAWQYFGSLTAALAVQHDTALL